MSISRGTHLGPYEILGLLGAGGMGEVYRASDARLGRDVAVKVLPAELAADRERLARFEQEARAAAALNHPHILALYDIGTHDGVPYLVTELLSGQTLGELLAGGPLPARRAVGLAAQLAAGLAAAHEQGIVHRDLKPDNVFVTNDEHVKILDFGLAKLLHESPAPTPARGALTTPAAATPLDAPRTESGTVLGTLGYMAPEQVRGLAVDHRADVFAFGAILYEMLTGYRAFQRETPADTVSAILREDPPQPPANRPLSSPLARIVTRCVEKQAGARFQSMRDLAFALDDVSTDSGLRSDALAAGAIKFGGGRRFASREGVAWMLAAILLATALGAAFLGRAPEQAVPADTAGEDVASSEPATLEKSIAVLPFVNLSNDPEQEYFSDGLSEELLNKLAQVSDLQVAARTSSFSFKGRNEDMRVIGETLGVSFLLEGSVRSSGDQLRITAQLIQADNGFHLWSETYDRRLADIFAIQDEISLAVSTALQVTLGTGTFALPGNTRNVEAYQHFLKALAYLNGGGSPDEVLFLQNAVDESVQAVTLAPDFARAWSLLYRIYRGQVANASQERVPELTKKQQEAYDTALALAPDMPELQLAAAAQLTDRAERERALLDILQTKTSSQALATAQYASFLSEVGRMQEALPYAEQAVRLNPAEVAGYYLYGSSLLIQGRQEEASRVLQRGEAVLNGGQGGFLPVLGWKLAYAESGRQGWGERLLAEIDADSTNATAQWNRRYAGWLIAEDPQQALEALRAYATDPALPLVIKASFAGIATMLGDLDLAEEYLSRFGILDPWESRYSELRKREGFKIWARNNGLLDYWRASGNWSDFCRPMPETENDFECF